MFWFVFFYKRCVNGCGFLHKNAKEAYQIFEYRFSKSFPKLLLSSGIPVWVYGINNPLESKFAIPTLIVFLFYIQTYKREIISMNPCLITEMKVCRLNRFSNFFSDNKNTRVRYLVCSIAYQPTLMFLFFLTCLKRTSNFDEQLQFSLNFKYLFTFFSETRRQRKILF